SCASSSWSYSGDLNRGCGHRCCHVGEKFEIQCGHGISLTMVMRIPEVRRIGQHHSWIAYIPERGMVATTGMRHGLPSARHHQRQGLEQSRLPPGILFKLKHQRSGCLVAHDREKVSPGRHRNGYTRRNLLRVGFTPGEPDTFQDNRTGQLTALGFQAGRERLTPQSILLLKTECHEPDGSDERLCAEARSHF